MRMLSIVAACLACSVSVDEPEMPVASDETCTHEFITSIKDPLIRDELNLRCLTRGLENYRAQPGKAW